MSGPDNLIDEYVFQSNGPLFHFVSYKVIDHIDVLDSRMIDRIASYFNNSLIID